MKHIKQVLFTLALTALIAPGLQAMQADTGSEGSSGILATLGKGASCIGSTASGLLEGWNEMPERYRTAACVAAGIFIYHNYHEFLKNECSRRGNLYTRMAFQGLPKNDALKELNRFRNKVCPFLKSKSVESAIHEFYGVNGRSGGDINALKNALCPESKPFWLLNSWF